MEVTKTPQYTFSHVRSPPPEPSNCRRSHGNSMPDVTAREVQFRFTHHIRLYYFFLLQVWTVFRCLTEAEVIKALLCTEWRRSLSCRQGTSMAIWTDR